MKVIFAIVSMAGGGAERVISILANRFVKEGIEVGIVMTAGDTVDYQLDERIELFCAGETSGGSMIKRLKRIMNIRKYLKNAGEGIIISFGPGTSFFMIMADLFLKHPFIISERNDPAACPCPRLRNLFYRRAKCLVFQTGAARECFPKAIKKKGCVIANPIKKELPEAYDGEREKTVVAVGRLEVQKNYSLLLEAFGLFYKEHPEYTLHIYGKGALKEQLEQEAQSLGLASKVVFEGFKTNVLEEIRTAGIYAISSDYEGISNAMIEAMALELPVVATDCPIGGAAFCIEDGVNGLLVPCRDKEELAKALGRIAGNPDLAKAMGKEAGKVRTRFAEEAICEEWLALIKELA